MSNYLQFSDQIENLTADEHKWWEAKLAELVALQTPDEDRDAGKTEAEIFDQKELGYAANCFEVESEGVWVKSEESGDVEAVADIIQEFLKTHRSDGYFSFEWAMTCSKLRIGEFGGGGVFITAEDIRFFSPSEQIHEATVAFNKAKSNE